MTTPIRPVPPDVGRWISLATWFRRGDAALAWLILWSPLASPLGPALAAVLSAAIVALGASIRPVRVLWRPISGTVGLLVSQGLRPGDRAWYVRSEQADLVLVTARHGARLVIATPDPDEPDEVLSVRRTRVLLLPTNSARPH
jgi:hypothetical protein